jgi:hypothetical protein
MPTFVSRELNESRGLRGVCESKQMPQEAPEMPSESIVLEGESRMKCTKCVKCGSTEKPNIHHKDGNWENNTIENLICLCFKCHTKWHKGEWTYEQHDLVESHISNEEFSTYYPLKRGIHAILYVQNNVISALERYAASERKRQKDNPVLQSMITWKSLANHILRNEVEKRGFYKPEKTGKGGV